MKRQFFKHFMWCCLLILMSLGARPQNQINRYEYWFDNDSTSMVTTTIAPSAIAEINTAIPTANLTPGLHLLYLRFRDDSARYSSIHKSFFIIPSELQDTPAVINSYEYWFDMNRQSRTFGTLGSSQSLQNIISSIPTSIIADGFHLLHIRFKDSQNRWSSTITSPFLKNLGNPAAQSLISGFEYWTDASFTTRIQVDLPAGLAVLQLDSLMSSFNLPAGYHYLHIRFHDDQGRWSTISRNPYYKPVSTSANLQLISAYRYWFDNNHSSAVTLSLNPPISPLDLVASLDMTSIPKGSHRLHLQYLDVNGKWSLASTDTINKVSLPVVDFSFIKSDGCDSTVVSFQNLSIDGDVYLWDFGDNSTSTAKNPVHSYFSPGEYNVLLTITDTITHVDTSFALPVHVIKANSNATMIVSACNSYPGPSGTKLWTTSGVYYDTLINYLQCDSIIRIELTIKPEYALTQNVSVCSGDSYTFPDNFVMSNITAAAQHVSNLISSQSCDSVITTIVAVKPEYAITQNVSVCSGDSYTFPDNFVMSNITTAAQHVSNLISSLSCDSVITTIVAVKPEYAITQNVSICSGDSYTFPDNFVMSNITAPAQHVSNLISSLSCDSVITTIVAVKPEYALTQNVSVCSGDTYTFPDNFVMSNITAPAMHVSNLISSLSCDSVITTIVAVKPEYAITQNVSICSGDSYTFPDNFVMSNITAPAQHVSNLISSLSCDSVITTIVAVKPEYALTQNVSVCSGDTYTFPDNFVMSNITAPAMHVSNLISSLSCDSVITTIVAVKPEYAITQNVSVCSGDSYTFPDNFVMSNITAPAQHVSNLISSLSCDSVITTIVAVKPEYALTQNVSVCSGDSYTFPDNFVMSNITAAAQHVSNLMSSLSCDSVITTIVAVKPEYALTQNVSVCSGDSYTFPDNFVMSNITAAAQHVSNLISSLSCDSVITTIVAVKPEYAITQNVSVCSGDSYTFPDNFVMSNITAAAQHVSNLMSSLSCDSVITTIVAVKPEYALTQNVSVCSGDSYTFPDNFVMSNITAPAQHVSNLISSLSCDSVITTIVAVKPEYALTQNVSVCSGDSYTFPDNFVMSNITAPAQHVSNLISSLSCDSVITTIVAVKPEYAITQNVSVCSGDSYTFPDNFVMSNITGHVQHISNLVSSESCDSVITTNVTAKYVDTTVVQSSIQLTATANGAQFQWVNCSNGYSIISGATSSVFSATQNGQYAVIVTQNGCTDTSSCHKVFDVGLSPDDSWPEGIVVFPNPATTSIHILYPENELEFRIAIFNLDGQQVSNYKFYGEDAEVSIDNLPVGIYMLRLTINKGTGVYFTKVVKM